MATTQRERQTKQETAAPEAFVPAQPGKEHRWLEKLVGEWTYEAETPSKPGQSPERSTGSERVRMLGDLWLLAEGQGEMPGGGEATTLLTIGYDPQKQTFLGTWIGSMMTHLWVYERGELDAAEKVLTLHSEGPNMAGDGGLTRYRETLELKGDDHRVFSSHMRTEDGSWQPIMTATYRRRRAQTH